MLRVKLDGGPRASHGRAAGGLRGRRVGLLGLLVVGLTTVACDEGARPTALSLADNRLYSGAPPTIPHPVVERARQECLSCHLHGDATGDDGTTLAKATPHPELEHCVACHVPTRGRGVYRRSTFWGKTYRMGLRSHPMGPWAIPHPLTMRENCLGCHDTPRTHAALRVTHPERQRCVQCHLPAHDRVPEPRPDAATVRASGELLVSHSL